MLLMAPADENELRQMLYTGFQHSGPAAVRYPRGQGPGVPVEISMHALEPGRSRPIRSGAQIAILCFGSLLTPAREVADNLNATLIDMRFIKPLDTDTIDQAVQEHTLIVTIEENVIAGGAGSAVAEYLNLRGIPAELLHLGLPDRFVAHGRPADLLAQCGLDANGIEQSIRTRMAQMRINGASVIDPPHLCGKMVADRRDQ
jgi:1-deoxy-D-xylulose-5-phosphate synthase